MPKAWQAVALRRAARPTATVLGPRENRRGSVGIGSLEGADQEPILIEELEDFAGDFPAVVGGIGASCLDDPLQHLVFAKND